MSKKDIYSIRSTEDPTKFRILKCDMDFNPTGEYHVSKNPSGSMNCSCFAGNKDVCRHRTMVIEFQLSKKVDSNSWFHFESRKWVQGPQHA